MQDQYTNIDFIKVWNCIIKVGRTVQINIYHSLADYGYYKVLNMEEDSHTVQHILFYPKETEELFKASRSVETYMDVIKKYASCICGLNIVNMCDCFTVSTPLRIPLLRFVSEITAIDITRIAKFGIHLHTDNTMHQVIGELVSGGLINAQEVRLESEKFEMSKTIEAIIDAGIPVTKGALMED